MDWIKDVALESTANGLGPKVVETIAKTFVEQADMRWDTGKCADGRTARGSVPANETIVEREIREQRERESALALQRAAAASLRNAAPNQIAHEYNYSKNKVVKNSPSEGMSKSMVLLPTRETHVLLNTDHEQQNFVADSDVSHKDGIMKTSGVVTRSIPVEKSTSIENLSNDLSFQYSNKDSWQSDSSQNADSSQNEIRDIDTFSTQNMDAGSNSSQDFQSTRSIMVKPLSEPEEDASSYIRWQRQKETPIEREIRLARQREEELRREKGLPPLPANHVVASTRKPEVQKFANRRNTGLNDCRSVQHRIATSRIQQEINEATEREKELHAAGLIQTISEDTVDSKVTRFTDLAGYAIEETERKLRRAVSTSSVAAESENQSPVTSSVLNGQKTPSFRPLFESSPMHSNNNILSSSKKLPPRVGHKGVMQRFLASHGKVSPVSVYSRPNLFTSVTHSPSVSPVQFSKDNVQKIDATEKTENEVFNDFPRKNSRHGYMSAEERIQAELQEMQKREEELRLQRAKIFAQSQPNLLSIGDFEESELNHDSEEMRRSISGDTDSSSQLENSKDSNGDSSFPELSQWNSRKKSSLIAQWENRIQQNMHSEWDS